MAVLFNLERLSRVEFFLVLSILSHKTGLSQNIWPPTDWKDSVHCERRHSGYICIPSCNGDVILTNGDSIKNCYVRIWRGDCDILKYRESHVKTISNFNINCIYARVPQFNSSYTEMIHVYYGWYKNDFWRIIKQKDSIMICDLVGELSFTSAFSDVMLLVVSKKQLIKIYGVPIFVARTALKKEEKILNFINERYGQSFDNDHFKSPMDMIDYIIGQENMKLHSMSLN